jgi:hypothetical protein
MAIRSTFSSAGELPPENGEEGKGHDSNPDRVQLLAAAPALPRRPVFVHMVSEAGGRTKTTPAGAGTESGGSRPCPACICRRSGGIALSCLAALSWMWTIQVMSELGERGEFSLAHLPFGLLHESALFGGEDIVRINHASGLDEHSVLVFSEGNEIPLLDVEVFEHLTRDDHLAPLAYATDPLLGCG